MAAFSVGEVTLSEAVNRASELNGDETRLEAVAELKALSLNRDTAQELCDLLTSQAHPAVRTAAAQVLGFHRACVRFSEVKAELVRRAEHEADFFALQALVFALRETDGVLPFFVHECQDVCIEAVVGVPVLDEGLKALLEGVVGNVTDAVAWAMCRQLVKFENITGRLVACLMAVVEPRANFDERVLCLFAEILQDDLLDALTDVSGDIERTYQTIWPGIWRREQQRRLLGVFVRLISKQGASKTLIEMLVQKVGKDATFYSRYLRFVRLLVAGFRDEDAVALVTMCRSLGEKSNRECLSRLAEVLVGLVGSVPGVADLVLETLGDWEDHLPGVRLKAFHAAR